MTTGSDVEAQEGMQQAFQGQLLGHRCMDYITTSCGAGCPGLVGAKLDRLGTFKFTLETLNNRRKASPTLATRSRTISLHRATCCDLARR